MTLSHCWGETQFIQLGQSNQDAFRQGIPWSSFPQTFKDAIRIARFLGSEYLWIDSLCILQDCAENWLAESATMGDIYTKSTCNIAASGASNCHEGCFYPRDYFTLHPQLLPWSSGSQSDFYLVNQFIASKHPNKLYSHAWVL